MHPSRPSLSRPIGVFAACLAGLCLLQACLTPRTKFSPGKAGLEWVSIPGGSYMMGSEDFPWSMPVHRVQLKSFQMARGPVTFKQYRACVAAGACIAPHVSDGTCLVYDGAAWKPGILPASFQGDDQPVVCVDWEQARAFSQWVGGRLPSEAETEYAARSAGKDYRYPWGNEPATCARAVMDDGGGKGCGRNRTWPVCSKPKGNTEQGLCDMAGNVWEWMAGWFHDNYVGAPEDGRAWESPASAERVARGGSWRGQELGQRAVIRAHAAPGLRTDYFGFCPARSSAP
jgi:formylglycine-generating enzyme required for sulfatase activity